VVFLCGMIVGIFQLGMEIRFFYITFIILSIYPVKAQNSYSLNFDGEADYVEVPYGSAMIANAGQITLSGWVYPRNTNSGWPDFDAFFGFRNESDADFYLLQLDNYKVEGRLRVTENVAYTVVTAAESNRPDTWYHLALTYDGANLFVYINGIEAGSTEASGQIINENVSLTIGRLVFQTTNFDLDGQADEVSLWNIALTEQQIQDYMYADLTGEAGLVGYSILRSSVHSELYHDLIDTFREMDMEFEGVHTETGPGVLEACISFDSGLYGIEHKLELPPGVVGNAYDLKTSPENEKLPETLKKSTASFHQSSVMRELFGDEWVDHFSLTRKWEAQCYNEQKKGDPDWRWMLDHYFEII